MRVLIRWVKKGEERSVDIDLFTRSTAVAVCLALVVGGLYLSIRHDNPTLTIVDGDKQFQIKTHVSENRTPAQVIPHKQVSDAEILTMLPAIQGMPAFEELANRSKDRRYYYVQLRPIPEGDEGDNLDAYGDKPRAPLFRYRCTKERWPPQCSMSDSESKAAPLIIQVEWTKLTKPPDKN